MADVTRRDRGQVIVVGALVIAVLFVGMAVVLNGAIYAQNRATQDTETDTQRVLQQQQMIEEDMAETTDRLNAHVGTQNKSEVKSALEAALDDQDSVRAAEAAQRGVSVEAREVELEAGTRLRQTNESRNFTSPSGDDSWTLIEGVPEGGQFKMTLRRDSIFQSALDTTMALLAQSAFGVEFRKDGDEDDAWRVYFFSGALTDSAYLVTEKPDQEFESDTLIEMTNPEHIAAGWLNQSCSMEAETLSVDFDEATFGGSRCEHLSFYSDELDQSGNYTVRFLNARTHDGVVQPGGVDRAVGTYDIMIDQTDDTEVKADFGESAEDQQPFQQAAVYGFNYSYEYRTEETTYTISNSTLTPRDRDTGGILWEHPRIDQFELNHTRDGAENAYEVDWRVSDPNGKLERVEIQVVDRTVEELEEGASEDVDDLLYTDDVEDELETLLKDGFGDVVEDAIGDTIDEDNLGPIGDLVGGLLGILDPLDIGADDLIDNPGDYAEGYIDTTTEAIINLEQPFNTNQVVNSSERSVSGPAASGEDTLSDTNLVGGSYEVQFTVVNEAGHTTTIVKECDPSTCEVVE